MKAKAVYPIIILYAGMIFSFLIFLQSCGLPTGKTVEITSGDLSMVINANLETSLFSSIKGGKEIISDSHPAEYLISDGKMINSFQLSDVKQINVTDEIGTGKSWILTGDNNQFKIRKISTYTTYDSFPNMIFTQFQFTNQSEHKIILDKYVTNQVQFKNNGDSIPYYAFQGSSTSARKDWIRPLRAFYYDKNYMGMNNSDYGGGIPVVDLWNGDVGAAIGHTALVPKLISFPTSLKSPNDNATIAMEEEFDYPHWFDSGDTIVSLPGFFLIHSGDYYNALTAFSNFMKRKGIEMTASEEQAFEPIWCAWGYERKFTKEELIGTLDKVKELGIKWAVVDDGFQVAEGDWNVDKSRFPGGNNDMKEMVNAIHSKGLKAKIWWTPLAADPGSKILQEHPDAILYTSEWIPQIISWWNAYYLSPVNPYAIEHTKEVIKMFMEDWGFDGFKMDGQHMNAVPPDHNPAAGIDDPIASVEGLPAFFKMIYDEARSIKPNAVIENCPCGTCMSFYNMTSTNQFVSSDPLSSWQIRHKGKTYKALAPHIAYYGDHVELSDNASDFASSMGIGAVLGTKFTYPKDNPEASGSYLLTPEKEEKWKKWFALYNDHMISKETYLGNLYDIAYDVPETHVIKKNNLMYYAFYAADWNGEVTFKGLDANTEYRVIDYVQNVELGKVKGENPKLNVIFSKHLLVYLEPVQN